MSVSINGTNGLTFNDGSAQTTAASGFGFKNRIINGDMRIDQRNNGAAVNSASGGSFAVDRFKSFGNSGGVYTTQRSTDVPTGQGFVNSIVATVTTTDSPTGSDYYLITQEIEGFNFADLQWGSASAKSVTLSFWVKSSLTGTYTAAFRNSALNRSYRAAYTINAANTWEQKTITVPGDTTGTWLTDNGIGVQVGFTLGAGADFIDTANMWSAVDDFAATGQTQWIATNGATFYLTGVQLEKGSTATSFDYRPYGTELQLAQRYLPVWYASNGRLGIGMVYSGTNAIVLLPISVTPRVAPTGITVAGTSYLLNSSAAGITVNSITFNLGSISRVEVIGVVSSGLTAGNATVLGTSGTLSIQGTGCEL